MFFIDHVISKNQWEEISGLNADFIRICLEEAARVGYKGTSLKDVSWNRLKEELTTKYSTHEIEFDQKFLKNHWNHLKKKYNAWIACIGRSGHGFNARYPEAEKYRKNPLPHAQELYNLFESTLSNGESKLTPAADGMPTDSDATSQTINIGTDGVNGVGRSRVAPMVVAAHTQPISNQGITCRLPNPPFPTNERTNTCIAGDKKIQCN
ncbi:hypothetical protein IFM89_007824 [Coptis chinensis]|uniref:Myb/SANT-like domain-containing protein n=1 Tax=Coptis chinensis TaxID=261450 RepID=A0A835I1Y2_9MAGN|nr:hypothetical protein IFM89_007824 [Coptis chinensis]